MPPDGETSLTLSRSIPVPGPRGGELELPADLVVPRDTVGCVAFAHGSGSGRLSPRNRQVAGVLNDAGLATLLLDLLTPGEAGERHNVFDVELLAVRLAAAGGWLEGQPETLGRPLGYFGASTGAAAALRAAAGAGPHVGAVVSRGGRPDLAGPWLPAVRSPTLLIVGALDEDVLALNRDALARLRCEAELTVVPGATHLFEEPGTLEQVAALARDWFLRHLEGPR
jgi:putative phosphoribosyl transferase